MLRYARLFDPPDVLKAEAPDGAPSGLGDRRAGGVYVFEDSIVLAVNVALAANRPLLVSGEPGSGKSSLAACVAAFMDWRYVSEVITPGTQANDLQWRYDALRRLRDAQARKLKEDAAYVHPGVLWRAFRDERDLRRAVVLLDEIDKADPDVPNSLLEALGSLSFKVRETGEDVTARRETAPFVMLTTNNERELPRPFVRRCISLSLPVPDEDRLKAIAAAHGFDDEDGLVTETSKLVVRLQAEARAEGRPQASAAELLDALRACRELKVRPGTPEWEAIADVTLAKADGAER